MVLAAAALLSAVSAAPLFAEGPVSDPSLDTTNTPLPQIDVRARRELERGVDSYIFRVTRVSVGDDDRPVALWKTPICPVVAGLPHDVGQALFDHFTDTLDSLGRPRGNEGCRPNFFIIVASRPEARLRAWWHLHPSTFSHSADGTEKFLGSSAPVRVWYNSRDGDLDGITALAGSAILAGDPLAGVPTFQEHGNGLNTRTTFRVVPTLVNVVAVVDVEKVDGIGVAALAEYIAMAGLTKVNLDANYRDSPTILRLFSGVENERPQALSSWDRSFLDALYKTEQTSRLQRVAVVKRMVATLAH